VTNEEREALIAQGWTPPVAVDPDLAEAETLWGIWFNAYETPLELAIKAIKRGRELERAEAKPGLVWVKHDGSAKSPIAACTLVVVKFVPSAKVPLKVGPAEYRDWQDITHYAIITPPAEDK